MNRVTITDRDDDRISIEPWRSLVEVDIATTMNTGALVRLDLDQALAVRDALDAAIAELRAAESWCILGDQGWYWVWVAEENCWGWVSEKNGAIHPTPAYQDFDAWTRL